MRASTASSDAYSASRIAEYSKSMTRWRTPRPAPRRPRPCGLRAAASAPRRAGGRSPAAPSRTGPGPRRTSSPVGCRGRLGVELVRRLLGVRPRVAPGLLELLPGMVWLPPPGFCFLGPNDRRDRFSDNDMCSSFAVLTRGGFPRAKSRRRCFCLDALDPLLLPCVYVADRMMDPSPSGGAGPRSRVLSPRRAGASTARP